MALERCGALRYLLHMDQTSQEHGIAVVQLIAAERHQRDEGGIYRQHRWSVAHLDERIVGLLALWLIVLSVIVALSVSPWAGAGLGVCTGLAWAVVRDRRRRRLSALREAQVAEHRRQALR